MIKTVARAAVFGGVLYVGDLWYNDDLSSLTRSFRHKLPVDEQQHRPRVVVLGSGFGALNLVRRLNTDRFRVTVVSPVNYSTFSPMLPRAMSGKVQPTSIIEPFRKFCGRTDVDRVQFVEAEALSVHPDEQRVICRDSTLGPSALPVDAVTAVSKEEEKEKELSIDYDYLVMAVGAEGRTFGVPGAKEHAFPLRTVEHARRIRNHVLDCFEAATLPGQTEEAIDSLLHFVVVGGGFVGTEAAAELSDMLHSDIVDMFPQFKERIRVSLFEAKDTVLPDMPPPLTSFAEDAFKRQRVQLHESSIVSSVTPSSVTFHSEMDGTATIPTRTVIWATGNGVRHVVKSLGRRIGEPQSYFACGLGVDTHLRVKGTDNIWAIGDCASSGLPPTANVASQQGVYLARAFNETAELMFDRVLPHNQLLRRSLSDNTAGAVGHESDVASPENAAELSSDIMGDIPEFKYKNQITMGYVGEGEAVFTVPVSEDSEVGVSGPVAWAMYRGIFFSRLFSLQNRLAVTADVVKSWIFGRNTSRW